MLTKVHFIQKKKLKIYVRGVSKMVLQQQNMVENFKILIHVIQLKKNNT